MTKKSRKFRNNCRDNWSFMVRLLYGYFTKTTKCSSRL